MGATVVMVEMPGFSDLLSGSGVIGNEFKWDLMDYLAATPGAPVASLGEMIELGLVHDAVVGLMRRWNAPEARDSDEYRQALAQREVLRDAMLALMDERGLDALAYPTIRRLPARVGDGQAGSACQLSAHTGLPALVMPAGWADGLPVGMELLGRPFDDARLVAFAYAYQSESDLRRPPATTPALPAASTPGETRTFEARATNGDAAVTATFELDVASSRLGYATAVTGVAAERVHAVVLRHADDDGRWSVAAHLSGPGVVSATGAVELTSTLLARLEGGALYLELVAAGDPFTTARAPLLP
jgi:hypothetical protein